MFEGFSVVFVEDDEPVRTSLAQTMMLADLEVHAFASAEAALARLTPGYRGVVVSDIRLPGASGTELLHKVRALDAGIPVILITAQADVALAVKSMQEGAYDFLEKPFDPERLIDAVKRALEKRSLSLMVTQLRTQLADRGRIESVLLGHSARMVEMRRQLLALAGTHVDVMLLGETGAGKEMAARCLHDNSPRRDKHFVAINCGGVPESLLESELFGHEAGAFTTAMRRRIGKLEHANGGTLFLDEIESMPMTFQIKLLRVLQERQIERLGSNQAIPIDIRVITATKDDLLTLATQQKFRSDLYYRLNVATVMLPPLRERREDVMLLFEHFMLQAAQRFGRDPATLAPVPVRALLSHDWPGNVRELRNAADRFVLGLSPLAEVNEPPASGPTLGDQMEAFEKLLLQQALKKHRGRPGDILQALGIAKKTLYDKVHRHGLKMDDYR